MNIQCSPMYGPIQLAIFSLKGLALTEVLRDSAQSIAVVTSHMSSENKAGPHLEFHDAMLSSFSSIALDLHPLVALSLRAVRNGSLTTEHFLTILSACRTSTAIHFTNRHFLPHAFAESRYSLTEGTFGIARVSGNDCVVASDLGGR